PNSAAPHALQKVETKGPNGTSVNTYSYFPDGATQTRNIGGNAQTFTYDYEGHAVSETEKAGTSTYVYDAAGLRIITHDSTGATLMVGDLQLFEAAGTDNVTAPRYYDHGGGKVAQRVGTASLTWSMGDLHGTGTLSITQGTLAASQRYS